MYSADIRKDRLLVIPKPEYALARCLTTYRIVFDTMMIYRIVDQEIPKCIYTFLTVFNTSLNIS